jgi:hypothetical protein
MRRTTAWAIVGTSSIVISYFGGQQAAIGAPGNCQTCPCKMLLAWTYSGDGNTYGMKTQANPPVAVQHCLHTNVEAAACSPHNCNPHGAVQKWQYFDVSVGCVNPAQGWTTREASVSDTGVCVGNDVNWQICKPNP